MHEAHGGSAENLRILEGFIRSPAIHVRADDGEQLTDAPAKREAQSEAQEEAVDDLDPLLAVHAVEAALDGERGTGEAGDEAMALARGDAEDRCSHAVDNDREQRSAQRDERHVRVRAEVDHVGNGGGNRRVDHRHEQHAEEIEHGAHDDRGPDADAPGGDGRCDGVRRVRPAVDEDDAQGQQNRDGQDGVRHDLADEMG